MRGTTCFACTGVIAAAVMIAGFAQRILAGEEVRGDHKLMEQVEGAKTATDHLAVAASFEAEAKASEQKAADHDTMAERYVTLMGKGDWPTHCRNAAAYYRKVAAEYRSLAELHRRRAGELQRP